MRNMRSPLPFFIFIGLALITLVGVIVLESSATAAIGDVSNNTEINVTEKEDLSLGIYELGYGVGFGISAILFIIALYFALKALT